MFSTAVRPDFAGMQLAIFRREDPGGILWQPRLDYWYNVNRAAGTLPPHLKDASLLDVYDYCHASIRYTAREAPWLTQTFKTAEVVNERESEATLRRTWHTPVGSITELHHYDEWGVSSHLTEYRVKTVNDVKVMMYLLQDEEWVWNEEQYAKDMAIYGEYGAPQFYYRRSPVVRMFINEMGLENTIFFMLDHPALFQEYVELATAADDPMYDIICNCPVPILNLGENIDAFIDPPPIWNQHLVPYYNKRIAQLHAAGKYVTIHVDGTMKPLLPYLQACPFDAIEAATPLPQGDVTIEEIHEALGDMILVDGIPALYFIQEQCSEETLVETTRKVVGLFHPRLILGASDEVPPPSDIERVRLVGELVQGLG